MRKLSAREQLILMITLALIVVFGVYQGLLKPFHLRSEDVKDQIALDQAELMKMHRLMEQKDAVQARYQQLINTIGVVSSPEQQIAVIVSNVEAMAHQANIHIGNIQPQDTTTRQSMRFISVQVEIDGGWLDLVRFLYTLQQEPNFYFIKDLNLEKNPDVQDSLRGRVVISRLFLVNP